MKLYDHSYYTADLRANGNAIRFGVMLHTERSESPNPFAWAGGWSTADDCALDGTPMRLPGAQPTRALDCEATSPR